MRKISILLTGLMAFGVGGIARADAVLLDFEDLMIGSTYTVPSTFTTLGTITTSPGSNTIPVTITVGHFDQGIPGGPPDWTTGSGVTVDDKNLAGGTGKDLHTNNVNLAVKFDSGVVLDRFSILFGEYGGSLNLGLNGHFENFQNFEDIPNIPITFPGGVVVSVTGGTGNDKGTIEISGPVTEHTYYLNGVPHDAIVVVGGQELWIDNIHAEGAPGTFAPSRIPTVSQWGLIVMAVLLVSAGTAVIFRRRQWIAT